MEMYERNKAIDILKAIGIVLVVMGHTGSGFTAYIYTFHMGLFFFVSGYLSYGKRKIESKEFIKKKCKHVLIPYVLFWSVSMIVSEIQSYLYMHSFTKLEVNHWLGLILGGHWLADYSINFPLWYLQLYFIADIVFETFVKKLSSKWKVMIFVLNVFITIPFQTVFYGRPVFHINVLPAAIVFMLMGYAFHIFDMRFVCNKKGIIGLLLMAVGWRISTIYYGNIADIVNNIYYLGAVFTIVGLYYIACCISDKNSILQYIGTKTLWIMGMHALLKNMAYNFMVFVFTILNIENTFIVNIATVLFAILLCCGISEIVVALWKILKSQLSHKLLGRKIL